jgi:hypothetical protein
MAPLSALCFAGRFPSFLDELHAFHPPGLPPSPAPAAAPLARRRRGDRERAPPDRPGDRALLAGGPQGLRPHGTAAVGPEDAASARGHDHDGPRERARGPADHTHAADRPARGSRPSAEAATAQGPASRGAPAHRGGDPARGPGALRGTGPAAARSPRPGAGPPPHDAPRAERARGHHGGGGRRGAVFLREGERPRVYAWDAPAVWRCTVRVG